MLISSFDVDVDGIVHREFVSPRHTVNQSLLECVEKIAREPATKLSRKVQSGDWFLHHDNAPTHTALSIQQFLAKNKMVVVSHHPYSPNLAPCDFFCTHG